MDIKVLVKLTSRAWALDILAQFHRGTPGRQAALLHATGAGRTAFAQSLAHLIEIGLVERAPGHGHPLRPEFRLTASGALAARVAAEVQACLPNQEDRALLRRNWTLPVLALSRAPVQFSHLRARLAPVTDRALSVSLQRLEAQAWLRRDIDGAHRPPRPLYVAAQTGARISGALSTPQPN